MREKEASPARLVGNAHQVARHLAARAAVKNHPPTRVLFTSKWGRSESGEAETFTIALPADWPDWTAHQP